jgi:hypothetical protein
MLRWGSGADKTTTGSKVLLEKWIGVKANESRQVDIEQSEVLTPSCHGRGNIMNMPELKQQAG